MPNFYQSRWATGQEMTADGEIAGEVVSNLFEFPLPAAGLAAGDVIELGILPAGNRIVDALLVSDKLDGAAEPQLVFQVGIMPGVVGVIDPTRTVGRELFLPFNPSDYAQIVRISNKDAILLQAASYDRSIGVLVTQAAASAAPGALLRLQVRTVAADNFAGGAGTV